MVCRVSKTLCLSSVFGACVLKICVSPRSLGGGGGVSLGRAGSASPASSGLSCIPGIIIFLQMHIVFCCSKPCWNWPVRGLGGAKCSDTLRNCLNLQKNECVLQIPHLYRAVTAKHPWRHCSFWKSIVRVFEGGCKYLLLMLDFEEYKKPWFFALFCGQPAAFPAFPASLVFSVFGQFCVSESLEMLDAKIRSVPVRCLVASLACPASPASLP